MAAAPQLEGRPEVVIDVDVRQGLLSILLRNIGPRPALDVRTSFDKPFTGLGGRKAITNLRVFKRLAFMAPGKTFEQFVDPLAAYHARKQPLLITATVTYRDRSGARYEESMTHDLRVYLELGQARVIG